jgi:hypothetical protein
MIFYTLSAGKEMPALGAFQPIHVRVVIRQELPLNGPLGFALAAH